MSQDIPNLDPSIAQLPKDLREDLAAHGRNDLMFLAKGVLGYKDITESAHGALCIYVDTNSSQFKLMLMPRDHLKTTLVTITGNIQRALRNPNERILIANESATNAERMLRGIRQHCESNKVFRALYSDVIPKDTRRVRWNDSELDFARSEIYPEPTFDTIGMTGAFTSRHYSHICIDDPISEEAIKSEKVMEDTINRLSSVLPLLTDPSKDTIWIVGTRWALHDVYSWFEEKLGDRLARFVRAAIEDNQPIWPERFSLETLALKRSMMGEYKFSCLMMNNPRNEELQVLNVQDLRWWRWADTAQSAIELLDQQFKVHRRVRIDQLDITTTVDLAPAEKTTSDRNAVVTCGITPWGEAVVLEAWGKRCTPIELIDKLFEIHKRWHPRLFGIESVAYQKAFKYFLMEEGKRRNQYVRIEELKAQGKKEIRIRGLQPIMAVNRLYIDATSHMLRNEMADFPLGEHDDLVDALSMQLQLWRGRMSPEYWERYKKEEQKLLTRIRRGNLSLVDESPASWDLEDTGDDERTDSWEDTVFTLP
jgi:predicted phage terminase large subunit-like protein